MLKGKHQTLAEKEASFINMIKNLKPGKKYMFVEHPAYDDTEMETVFHIGYEDVGADRQGVTDLYKSERVKKAIEANNVQLVTVNSLRTSLPRSKSEAMMKAIDRYMQLAAQKGLDIHSMMIFKHLKVID